MSHKKSNHYKKKIIIVEDTNTKTTKSWASKVATQPKPQVIQKNVLSDGSDVKLTNEWNFWAHSIKSRDWSISGYDKLYTIKTVSDYWKLMNNFNKLGTNIMHFYLMRENIEPLWEAKENRYCGICSLKLDFKEIYNAVELLCSLLITNELLGKINCEIINGISVSPKINSRNSSIILKIWFKGEQSVIENNLNKIIIDKFGSECIQYKCTEPEN